jgi:class 3 adenylate cyclase
MNGEISNPASVENRRLAAIMFTDIVGFSRQRGANEAHTLRLLAVHNQVIEQASAAHHGHVIKTFGDAFLVDFPSVVHAVQCAQHVQAQFRRQNAELGQKQAKVEEKVKRGLVQPESAEKEEGEASATAGGAEQQKRQDPLKGWEQHAARIAAF